MAGTIMLHNGVRVTVRQAPLRLAQEVMRRLAQPAPKEQQEYAVWCAPILTAVERYVSVKIDADKLAQARALLASWAENGLQPPRSNVVSYLLWCVVLDDTRTDLNRIVSPIVTAPAQDNLQRRTQRRHER